MWSWQSATQEEGQAEDENRMDESGAPDEAANGHDQAPPGESPCPKGSRTSGMADHCQVGILSMDV